MKICIHTLGCKVNQYESDALAECLRKLGHDVTTELGIADVYILNSCAVTNEAERKSRQSISKFYALNPNAKVLVCGCASEKDDSQFSALKNVNFVSGVANKMKLIEKLMTDGVEIDPLPTAYEDFGLSTSSHTRAYVKIQDGCNNFCSYCIIPYLRGRSRSRDIVSILNEVEGLVSGAITENKPFINEIVLTGINISDFKIDGKNGLLTLLKELDKFDVRIRLGSLEQGVLTEEFLKELCTLKNFCPHFHLSMQSGSNGVLKRMNRKYTSKEYLRTVKRIRKYFKNPAITTDVIVGFLGETKKEFKEAILKVTKDHKLPSKISSIHLEEVTFFGSPVYLSDCGLKISNRMESYTYLDPKGKIAFKVLDEAKDYVDIWSDYEGGEDMIERAMIRNALYSAYDMIALKEGNKPKKSLSELKRYISLNEGFERIKDSAFEAYKIIENNLIIAFAPLYLNDKLLINKLMIGQANYYKMLLEENYPYDLNVIFKTTDHDVELENYMNR